MAGSSWSACPLEILVQCFATQADFTLSNVSADATCKAWQDALLAVADLITDMSVCNGPLSNQTHLLHKLPNLQTIKIIQAAGFIEGSDFHRGSLNNRRHSQQQAVRLPTSCTCLIMEEWQLAGNLDLSNLQELHIQAARLPLISFAGLASLQKLLVLKIVGGHERGKNALVTGSIVDLPKGLTQLQLRHCNFSEWVALPEPIANFWSLPPLCLRFGPEASKHLMALQHLELSYLGVDLRGEFADMSDLHTLVLEGSTVQITTDLTFLHAAKALHTLNLSKATFTCQNPHVRVSHILAAIPTLKHLNVTHCMHVSLPEYLQANNQLSALVFPRRDYCDSYFGCIRADLRRTGLDSSLLPAITVVTDWDVTTVDGKVPLYVQQGNSVQAA